MKAKYILKNLNKAKLAIKELAKDYRIRVKWTNDATTPKICVCFYKKIGRHTFVKLIVLPEDKIAYGKYKTGMLVYNVERQLVKWLKKIYG